MPRDRAQAATSRRAAVRWTRSLPTSNVPRRPDFMIFTMLYLSDGMGLYDTGKEAGSGLHWYRFFPLCNADLRGTGRLGHVETNGMVKRRTPLCKQSTTSSSSTDRKSSYHIPTERKSVGTAKQTTWAPSRRSRSMAS